MKNKSIGIIISAFLLLQINGIAQKVAEKTPSKSGWVSFGMRSTLSLFDDDGVGIGSGGQYRVQLSNRVNTDWYADYISINIADKVRSEFIHIGWSVLYYPMPTPRLLQPYILAGHCFDYNKKTAMQTPSITKGRFGSAAQMGIGTHFNLSEKFDISLTCQYMIHLTKHIDANIDGNTVELVTEKGSALEGHLLSTISINYKLFRLWKSK